MGKLERSVWPLELVCITGSGLVTAYVPKCGFMPLQTSFPEAMVVTDVDENCIARG